MSNLFLDLLRLIDRPATEYPGKLTWAHVKAMYPTPSPHEKEGRDGKRTRAHATQKNHRHIVGSSFKPRKLMKATPAEYRHRHLGRS